MKQKKAKTTKTVTSAKVAETVEQAETFKLPSFKENAPTIIVLAVCAVIFVVALAWIYSEDFLHGAGHIFSVYGDTPVEYETATVNEVLSEDIRPDEVFSDAPVGSQELSVTVTSGRYKGEQMVVHNYFGALAGVPVLENDRHLGLALHRDLRRRGRQ